MLLLVLCLTLKLSSEHAAITLKTCSGKADQAGAGSHSHLITTAAQLPSAALHRNCTRGAICSIGSAAGKISSGPGGSFPSNQGHATCLMPITRYTGRHTSHTLVNAVAILVYLCLISLYLWQFTNDTSLCLPSANQMISDAIRSI